MGVASWVARLVLGCGCIGGDVRSDSPEHASLQSNMKRAAPFASFPPIELIALFSVNWRERFQGLNPKL